MLKQKKQNSRAKKANNPPQRRGGFALHAKLKLWCSHNWRSELKAMVISVLKSPLTPSAELTVEAPLSKGETFWSKESGPKGPAFAMATARQARL
jgi:hypothetical protein